MSTDIEIVLIGRNQASRAIDQVSDSVHALKGSAQSAIKQGLTPFSNAVSTMVASYAVQSINALGQAIKNAVVGTVNFASDIQETASAFNVAFGDAADGTRDRINAMAKDMQRSQYEFERYALGFQNIFVPIGYGRQEAADMSLTLTGLVSDVASFHNALETDVMDNFRSGLVGEHEALRKYGIVITETSMKQELERMGKAELTGAMLEQAKVQARLNMILAATADAQGDAIRTGGSYANVMRGLQATVMDVRAGIGEKLLPVVTTFFREVADFIREHGKAFVDWFGKVLDTVKEWGSKFNFGGAVEAISEFVSEAATLLGTFIGILAGVEYRGETFADLFEYLPDSVEPFFLAMASGLYAVRDFARWVWDVLEPIRTWIAEHVKLSDVLTAFGLWLGSLVAGPIASFLLAIGGFGLKLSLLTGLVALIRTAWDNDWLGIRTGFESAVNFLATVAYRLRNVFWEHGRGALDEIINFVTKGETNFVHLQAIIQGFGTAFSEVFRALREWIGPYLTAAWETIKGWGAALVAWAGQNLPIWGAALARWGEAAWTWIRDIAIPRAVEKLGDWWRAISGWATQMLPAWGSKLAEWGSAAWTWIRDIAVPKAKEALAGMFRDLVNMIVPWGFDMNTAVGAAWNAVVDLLLVGLAALDGDWTGVWYNLKFAVRNAWTAITGVIEDGVEAVLDFVSPWVSRLGTTIGMAWNGVASLLMAGVAVLKGDWEGAWSHLKTAVETLWGAVSNFVTRDLGELWKVLSTWFSDHWPEWSKNIATWAGEAWKWLTETAIPNTAKQLVIWWGEFSDWFTAHWPDWRTNIGEWAGEAWGWLTETAIPKTSEHLGGWWREFRGWLDENGPTWATEMAQWAEDSWVWIRDIVIPETQKQLARWVEFFQAENQPGDKIKKWLTATFPTSAAVMESAWARLGDVFVEVSGDIEVAFTELGEALFGTSARTENTLDSLAFFLDWTFRNMVTQVTTSIEQGLLLIKGFLQVVQGDWAGAWETIKRISSLQQEKIITDVAAKNAATVALMRVGGEDVMEGFADGIDIGAQDVKKAVGNFGYVAMQEMRNSFDTHSPSRKSYAIAVDVVKGVRDGLGDWPTVSGVLSAARKLATDAINAIKSAAGVHSPSTETYAVGTGLIDGARMAVMDGASSLSTAMFNLGTAMVTAFSSSANGGLAAAGTSLEQQIRQILAMIEDQADTIPAFTESLFNPGSVSGIPTLGDALSAGAAHYGLGGRTNDPGYSTIAIPDLFKDFDFMSLLSEAKTALRGLSAREEAAARWNTAMLAQDKPERAGEYDLSTTDQALLRAARAIEQWTQNSGFYQTRPDGSHVTNINFTSQGAGAIPDSIMSAFRVIAALAG